MRHRDKVSALLTGRTPGADEAVDATRPPAVADPTAPDGELTAVKKPPDWSRPRSGAVRGMQASLRGLAGAAERLDEGAAIIELDPSVLAGSPIADRIADTVDSTMAILVESLRTRGQQVPILVRPHPTEDGRYQIAYGHRRVRAAATLGLTVRAVVKRMSDDELVIAQGKENLERRDLSYIERASFAARMDGSNFSRETICAAMAVDETEVSRYVAVARAIPERIVSSIGPAPKIGRPRWLALADRIKESGIERADSVIGQPGFEARPSDERFTLVLAAWETRAGPTSRSRVWKDDGGRKLARIDRTADRVSMSFDDGLEPGWADYLIGRLPELLAEYRAGRARSDAKGTDVTEISGDRR